MGTGYALLLPPSLSAHLSFTLCLQLSAVGNNTTEQNVELNDERIRIVNKEKGRRAVLQCTPLSFQEEEIKIDKLHESVLTSEKVNSIDGWLPKQDKYLITTNKNLHNNFQSSQMSIVSIPSMKMESSRHDCVCYFSENEFADAKGNASLIHHIISEQNQANGLVAANTPFHNEQPTKNGAKEKESGNMLDINFLDHSGDIWWVLDNIRMVSEKLKTELERSLKREMVLAHEVEHLRHRGECSCSETIQYANERNDRRNAHANKTEAKNLQQNPISLQKENDICDPEHSTSDTYNKPFMSSVTLLGNASPITSSSDPIKMTQSNNDPSNSKKPGEPCCGEERDQNDIEITESLPETQIKLLQDMTLLKATLETLQFENEALKAQVEQWKSNSKMFSNDIVTPETDIVELQQKNENLQNKLLIEERNCKECLKEMKKLVYKYNSLRYYTKDLEQEKRQLTSEKQAISHVLEVQKSENQRLQCDLQENKEKTNTLEKKLADIVKEFNFVRRLLDTTQETCKQQEKEIAALFSEKEALLQVLQQTKDEKLSAILALQEATIDRRTLQKEIDSLVIQKSAAKMKLLETTEKDEAEKVLGGCMGNEGVMLPKIAKLQEDNCFLQQELEQHVQKTLQQEASIRKLKEERVLLENCLAAVQNEKNALQLEMKQLHKDFIDLTNKSVGCFICKCQMQADSQKILPDIIKKEERKDEEYSLEVNKEISIKSGSGFSTNFEEMEFANKIVKTYLKKKGKHQE
ncbi:protein BCAP-like [Erpetoichthys calabaricus]|uniref:protein BCAP-like n=1 Tax=Erpetoichthys calabaricus TaxID=27687 RepID=UPI0022343249|nr:protein BCAP-like [Erpetoichthys calabaricus]